MRYGGKYSLKSKLLVEGNQNANDEAYIASAWTAIGAALSQGKLAGMTAVQGGTTGADVTITLANGETVPVEAKLSYTGTYGNPSLRGGSGIDPKTGTFQYGLSSSLSSQQKAIKTELQTAIAAANADANVIARATAVEKQNIAGTHQGCAGTGKRTVFKGGGIAAKWYQGKGSKGADYIHVKGYGLYLLVDGVDPLGLNAILPKNMQIPVYAPSGGESINVRMKMMSPKAGKNCSPMAEIKAVGSIKPSPVDLYNTAPFIQALKAGPVPGQTPAV